MEMHRLLIDEFGGMHGYRPWIAEPQSTPAKWLLRRFDPRSAALMESMAE